MAAACRVSRVACRAFKIELRAEGRPRLSSINRYPKTQKPRTLPAERMVERDEVVATARCVCRVRTSPRLASPRLAFRPLRPLREATHGSGRPDIAPRDRRADAGRGRGGARRARRARRRGRRPVRHLGDEDGGARGGGGGSGGSTYAYGRPVQIMIMIIHPLFMIIIFYDYKREAGGASDRRRRRRTTDDGWGWLRCVRLSSVGGDRPESLTTVLKLDT